MASKYRYIEVLVPEFITIRQAALTRNLIVNRTTISLITGKIISFLFIITYK
jgi:cobalt/nickel transport system permease protein